MKRFVTAVFSDQPLILAVTAMIGAVLSSLGLADLSSSAVAVVDAVAGLVVAMYVGGSAHVAAQTAKAAAATPSPPLPAAASTVQADVASVLKAAAEALSPTQG